MLYIEVQGGDYSIDAFLDYLQEKGYYDLIEEIKNAFGDDIAIAVCKELVQSNDCEIVVRIYMVTHDPSPPPINWNEPSLVKKVIEFIESKCKCQCQNIDEKTKNLILLIIKYYSKLKEMNEKEIIDKDIIDKKIIDLICRIIKKGIIKDITIRK